MDTSTLTQLINALRAETAEESISPESLGALLQKIVDLLATAGDDATLQTINTWKNEIQSKSVVTNVAQGDDDSNNIILNVDRTTLSKGVALSASQIIKQATTDRAGAMRAQQVRDLNEAKSNISTLQKQMSSLTSVNSDILKNAADITALQSQATAIMDMFTQFDGRITNAQSTANAAKTTANATNSELTEQGRWLKQMEGNIDDLESDMMYHIQCKMVAGQLYIRGDISHFSEQGLVPYIFRYSIKQSRNRRTKEEQRSKGQPRKGWHLFYGSSQIKVNTIGAVTFKSRRYNDSLGKYFKDPKYLFAEPKWEYEDPDDKQSPVLRIMHAHGKRTYNVKGQSHLFRFGIAFGLPSSESQPFNMRKLRTNITEFKVKVFTDENSNWINYFFSL